MPDFAVILAAGGRSTRFGGPDKLLTLLDGVPVLRRSVDAFVCRNDVASIIVASDQADTLRGVLPDDHRIRFAPAGPCRAASVLSAARSIDASIKWVAVHDAARPLVCAELIDRVFSAVANRRAVGPALPVSSTIKQATLPFPARVERTLPRESLLAMQTPQVMRRVDLLAAFEDNTMPLESVTDDLQLLEMIGLPIHLIQGDAHNIKITEPLDVLFAEAILRSRKNG